MNIGGDSDRLLLDERLLAYFALTRSTQHLCITRPAADDAGKLLAASPFWSRMEILFPDAARTVIQRDCEEDCIGTPRACHRTDALGRRSRRHDRSHCAVAGPVSVVRRSPCRGQYARSASRAGLAGPALLQRGGAFAGDRLPPVRFPARRTNHAHRILRRLSIPALRRTQPGTARPPPSPMSPPWT